MAQKRLTVRLRRIILDHWQEWLFFAVVLLRLPSLFEPFTYGDEGIYLTLGQTARRGLVLYREIHDNKPPLLYLLAAVAGNFEHYRLILFVWSLATIFLFYRLSQLLFPNSKLAVMVSTSLFAILSSSHTFEGNVGNAENFMLLPTIGAFFLIYQALDKMALRANFVKIPLLTGMLLGLAALFKVPAAFDFAAIVVFLLLVFLEKKEPNYRLLALSFLLLFLGFFLPLLISLVYFASQNALESYLKAAFFQNLPYLSSWTLNQPQAAGLPVPLLARGLVVFFLVLALFLLKRRISSKTKLILIWFAFSWFAALLSSRPYPHYLLQTLPALCLAVGLYFTKQRETSKEKVIPLALFIVLMITWATFRFWYYTNIPYYLNFYQYAVGLKSQEKYLTDFDPAAARAYQIAHYLRTHTLPEEKILIWGNDPFLYALAERLPVGRYTVAYHIIDFNGLQETMEALNRQPPRYLLVSGTEERPFPELQAFIQKNYLLATKIDSAQIFHLAP